jgi:hypothetical protein
MKELRCLLNTGVAKGLIAASAVSVSNRERDTMTGGQDMLCLKTRLLAFLGLGEKRTEPSGDMLPTPSDCPAWRGESSFVVSTFMICIVGDRNNCFEPEAGVPKGAIVLFWTEIILMS